MAIIAVDLMSSAVTCAALGKTGKILEHDKYDLLNLEGNAVSLLIQNQIKKLLNKFENTPMRIKSVGIAVPGIYYTKTGTVWAPNIPGWNNYHLKQDMAKFAEQNIRVKIASKRTCDILGEKWLGAAKKTRNAIYFSVGNGIGAGVLIDGRILQGFNDGVGAVGWLAVESNFKEEFKTKGCLEYLASGKGILNLVQESLLINPHQGKILGKKDIHHITIEDVFRAYDLKDAIAERVINKCIEYWGIAVANLISLFNPEIIIFGGSLFGPALQFLDEIKAEAFKWAQPIFVENVKFVKSELGANAGLFGAGHLAAQKF
jgi:glucokinase